MLVRFDLSSLPSDAIIDSASLQLYLESSGGLNPVGLALYPVSSPWDESTVTWNTMPTGLPGVPLADGWGVGLEIHQHHHELGLQLDDRWKQWDVALWSHLRRGLPAELSQSGARLGPAETRHHLPPSPRRFPDMSMPPIPSAIPARRWRVSKSHCTARTMRTCKER